MKIHVSAKFSTSEMSFHDSFNLDLTIEQIVENLETIKNLAIKRFKKKCDEHFKVEFCEMTCFEMYWFDPSKKDGEKEVTLFKKEKTN